MAGGGNGVFIDLPDPWLNAGTKLTYITVPASDRDQALAVGRAKEASAIGPSTWRYLWDMCLIVLAYKAYADFPLVLGANRDEFLDRPAEPARFWADAPEIFAGRDKRAGGTWMGITRHGRFAAITNYREMRMAFPAGPSRGALVREALEKDIDPAGTGAYAGFNLIYGPLDALRYHNNIDRRDEPLQPGVHALSNHLLDSPWPKVVKSKAVLRELMGRSLETITEDLFRLLVDESIAPDDQLPDTGLPVEMERAASSVFIRTPNYGTRCSTVLVVDAKGTAWFEERTWPDGGVVKKELGLILAR